MGMIQPRYRKRPKLLKILKQKYFIWKLTVIISKLVTSEDELIVPNAIVWRIGIVIVQVFILVVAVHDGVQEILVWHGVRVEGDSV